VLSHTISHVHLLAYTTDGDLCVMCGEFFPIFMPNLIDALRAQKTVERAFGVDLSRVQRRIVGSFVG